jgi:hypothetical protein
MLRRRISLLALLLVAAACGGGTGNTTSSSSSGSTGVTTTTAAVTTSTTPPGFTVTSDDGDLEIEVSFEAMAEDPGITIRVLPPEEYPPQLAGAAETPGTVIYSMEPDGLVFDAPVRVTRRLSASNFEGMADFDVPVVTLITATADGSGFELLGDLRVQRDGDEVFASGDTTHFSPLITVNEQITLRVRFGEFHRSFATEVGLRIDVLAEFTNAQSISEPPAAIAGVGYTRHADRVAFEEGEFLGIDCLIPGEFRPRVGHDVEFNVSDPAEGEPTLHSSPQLVPGLDRVQIKLKNVAPLICYDPATSLHGLGVDFEIATDHPGGVAWVPGGDFLGGNSASYAWFGGNVRLDGTWAGLIQDGNRNGEVDATDTMFPVYRVEDIGGMQGFIAPLFTFADYFVYVIDGNQFDWNPGEGYGAGTVEEMVPFLESLYRGDGRFDSAIGLISRGGDPFVYTVDSSEEVQSAEGAELEIFTPRTFRLGFRLTF